MLTVGGGSLVCCGVSVVHINVGDGPSVAVQALVVDGELLGYDLLLGMDSITQLGGITVNGSGFPDARNTFALQSPLASLTFTRNTTGTQMRGRRHGSGRAISHQYP